MNPENRKQILMMAALGGVLLLVLVYQFGIKGVNPPPAVGAAGAAAAAGAAKAGPTAAATGKAAPTVAVATAAPGAEPPLLQPVEIDEDALLKEVKVVAFDYDQNKIARDPMTPLIGQIRMGEAQPGVLGKTRPEDVLQKKVTGIMWDKYNPLAVVDDEVVGIGYTYPNGVKVQAIEQDKVVFKVGDSLFPVPLKEL